MSYSTEVLKMTKVPLKVVGSSKFVFIMNCSIVSCFRLSKEISLFDLAKMRGKDSCSKSSRGIKLHLYASVGLNALKFFIIFQSCKSKIL